MGFRIIIHFRLGALVFRNWLSSNRFFTNFVGIRFRPVPTQNHTYRIMQVYAYIEPVMPELEWPDTVRTCLLNCHQRCVFKIRAASLNDHKKVLGMSSDVPAELPTCSSVMEDIFSSHFSSRFKPAYLQITTFYEVPHLGCLTLYSSTSS